MMADRINVLRKADVLSILPGDHEGSEPTVTKSVLERSISEASKLAFSQEPSEKEKAYELTLRVLRLWENPPSSIKSAARMIFGRLGNFPGVALLEQEFGRGGGVPPRLEIEYQSRAEENEVSVGDQKLPATDFQAKLWHNLDRFTGTSVSAPTSAGKSFILSNKIAEIASSSSPLIVYIVPTRALIRQTARDIRKRLAAQDVQANVTTVPLPPEDPQEETLIYILTQERLLTLLSESDELGADYVIVDEAQSIQDDSRGVLLESAIERALAESIGSPRIAFLSPYLSNPEYYLEYFGIDDGDEETDLFTPVAQNLILVEEKPWKPQQADFELLTRDYRIDLGTQRLDFDFRRTEGVFIQRAEFVRSITPPEGCTIAFCNGPAAAEETAIELAEKTDNHDAPVQIRNIIDYVRRNVHREYDLVKCLEKGVAFHHGRLPGGLRSHIESAAEDGLFRYICSTSTLLHGVNLPAESIVLEDPTSGPGTPMNRADFLNLAGRAGRLLQEFQGNVWCLRPSEWRDDSYRGRTTFPVEATMDHVLSDNPRFARQAVEEDPDETEDPELASTVVSKTVTDFHFSRELIEASKYSTESNVEELREIDNLLDGLELSLPSRVYERSPSLDPRRLDELAQELESAEDLENWLPYHPNSAGQYERLEKILKLCERTLGNKERRSYSYFTWLANQWVGGDRLSRIIRRSDEVQDAETSSELRSAIRELLRDLDENIRHLCVNYLRAYEDVFREVSEVRGREDLRESIPPLHLFFETGVHEKTQLSLISLGLTRSAVLDISNLLALPPEATPKECRDYLSDLDLGSTPLPRLTEREVREVMGEF